MSKGNVVEQEADGSRSSAPRSDEGRCVDYPVGDLCICGCAKAVHRWAKDECFGCRRSVAPCPFFRLAKPKATVTTLDHGADDHTTEKQEHGTN